MWAFKIGFVAAIGSLVASLVACQPPGQNPVKDYPKVTSDATHPFNANAASTPPAPVVVPPAPDNTQQVCTEPFKVSVANDHGSKLLTFTENQESTYELTIRSFMGATFKIDTVNLSPTLSADFHAGRARLTLVKTVGNVGTYDFIWKPGKNSADQVAIETLALRYTSTAAKICGNDITESLNLLVMSQPTPAPQGVKP